MKLVTTAQMRELDRRTIEEYDTKGEVLMERAGTGVAMIVRRIAETAGFINPVIHLIAGRGQNGGDVFVAAKALKEQDYQVEVWVAARFNQISGDALVHFGRMKAAGIKPYELPAVEDWQDAMKRGFYAEIVVDGVLGIGLNGPARGPAAGAIEFIRSRAAESLVISIDVPSGLNADTGLAEGEAVVADVTATIGLPKVGLLSQRAIDHVGSLDVVEIGIPDELVNETRADHALEFVHMMDLKPLFQRRRRSSHKGDYGHALIVAGSHYYGGAAVLCARAALRSGAGLVTAMMPANLQPVMLADTPEVIVWPGKKNPEGALSAENLPWIIDELGTFTSIVIGPGITACDDTRVLLRGILKHATMPVVLDADAIGLVAADFTILNGTRAPLVLTPHPGELGQLLGMTAAEVQADRVAAVQRAVAKTKSVVVLKGAGSLIAAPDHITQVNMNGNPGMATAGCGDVLAGIIGGLLAQKMAPFDAARAGVFMHGRAGDYGAFRRSQASLIAGDVIEELPFALRDLALR